MSNQINLVQGDTGPDLTVALYDPASNSPIDVSAGSDSVRLHFRREGQTGTPEVAIITGARVNGGADGVVTFAWPAGALDDVGYYEGEIKIAYASSKIETVPDKLRFYVREKIQ